MRHKWMEQFELHLFFFYLSAEFALVTTLPVHLKPVDWYLWRPNEANDIVRDQVFIWRVRAFFFFTHRDRFKEKLKRHKNKKRSTRLPPAAQPLRSIKNSSQHRWGLRRVIYTTMANQSARFNLNNEPLFFRPKHTLYAIKVMTEGVATFSGLSLDRSGRNLKLRFSLYGYDRRTRNWNKTGVHLDTAFFHVGEGMPASLNLEQVIPETMITIFMLLF